MEAFQAEGFFDAPAPISAGGPPASSIQAPVPIPGSTASQGSPAAPQESSATSQSFSSSRTASQSFSGVKSPVSQPSAKSSVSQPAAKCPMSLTFSAPVPDSTERSANTPAFVSSGVQLNAPALVSAGGQPEAPAPFSAGGQPASASASAFQDQPLATAAQLFLPTHFLGFLWGILSEVFGVPAPASAVRDASAPADQSLASSSSLSTLLAQSSAPSSSSSLSSSSSTLLAQTLSTPVSAEGWPVAPVPVPEFREGFKVEPPLTRVPEFREGFKDEPPLTQVPEFRESFKSEPPLTPSFRDPRGVQDSPFPKKGVQGRTASSQASRDSETFDPDSKASDSLPNSKASDSLPDSKASDYLTPSLDPSLLSSCLTSDLLTEGAGLLDFSSAAAGLPDSCFEGPLLCLANLLTEGPKLCSGDLLTEDPLLCPAPTGRPGCCLVVDGRQTARSFDAGSFAADLQLAGYFMDLQIINSFDAGSFAADLQIASPFVVGLQIATSFVNDLLDFFGLDGVLLGAVGAYDWNGAVLKETKHGKVFSPKSSYKDEFPEALKNHAAYLGYSVDAVLSPDGSQLYIAGAPRFNHTGKVIIFTMNNNGNLTILQALLGQQIGSYFGSGLLSMDIDEDGQTDFLMVAAPMYYNQGLERGRVYIYSMSLEAFFIFHGVLEVSHHSQNSRLGSALAQIADMNGDGFKELVVGAPLEDDHQGAIYIFHSKDKMIGPHYKQRLSGAVFSTGLQYFGQSLHGVLDINGDGLVDLAVGALGAVIIICEGAIVNGRSSKAMKEQARLLNHILLSVSEGGMSAVTVVPGKRFQAFKFSSSNQAPAESLKPPWTHWPPGQNLAHPPSSTPPIKFHLRETTTKDQYCTSNFTTGDPSTSVEQTPTELERLVQTSGLQPFILPLGLNSISYQSRGVVRIDAKMTFEPEKINIFNKNCQRGGKKVTCMSVAVCLTVDSRIKTKKDNRKEVAVWYSLVFDEKRFPPWAVMDESHRQQPRTLVLHIGNQKCEHLGFFVQDIADYRRPIVVVLEAGLQSQDKGPVLDPDWPTTLRTELPFWNGCEGDTCIPDLILHSHTDLLNVLQFCSTWKHATYSLCNHQKGDEEKVFVFETGRKKMTVFAQLENRGENAYRTTLKIYTTPNLVFSSLLVKEQSDIQIECSTENRTSFLRSCNISAPFMRSLAQNQLLITGNDTAFLSLIPELHSALNSEFNSEAKKLGFVPPIGRSASLGLYGAASAAANRDESLDNGWALSRP
ncbi:hypothetical protein CRENBAI_010724 [Crenichthys baileyi]|uniref:Uncharacterized protein n=1 Tax=Crenichthys baileyi TaxID=28760 RepID=A0AAV9RSB2_9TELE